jgi:hypothetical protein
VVTTEIAAYCDATEVVSWKLAEVPEEIAVFYFLKVKTSQASEMAVIF